MTRTELAQQFSLEYLRDLFDRGAQQSARTGYDDCLHCMEIDKRHYEEVYPEFEFIIVEREVTITKVARQGEWMMVHTFDVRPR